MYWLSNLSQVEQFSRKILHLTRRCFEFRTYLSVIEKIILLKRFESFQPQLFILGLPRSGTTLVYQYIVNRLKVAYFTNGAGKYYLAPCLVTFLQNRIYGEYKSDFKSNYGKVLGTVAPREAGSFWGRFFGIEKYIHYEEISTKDIRTMQNTIFCTQYIFGDKPFVNKNVKHMLRINALSKIFPNAYFLMVERNLNDVALSNLRAKYKILKDPQEWWSVKPLNYEELKDLSAAEQVAYQLIALKNKMESDFSELPPERIFRVNYEQFCKEPESLVRKLKNTLILEGLKNKAQPFFKPSITQPKTSEEENLITLIAHATAR